MTTQEARCGYVYRQVCDRMPEDHDGWVIVHPHEPRERMTLVPPGGWAEDAHPPAPDHTAALRAVKAADAFLKSAKGSIVDARPFGNPDPDIEAADDWIDRARDELFKARSALAAAAQPDPAAEGVEE